MEAEIFGLETLSAQGSSLTKVGLLEKAHTGTLFLDEVSFLPQAAQARLIHYLKKGEFFRVGGNKPVRVDVRLFSGTSFSKDRLLQGNSFSSDLFYRLNVESIVIPPLFERRQDIALLAKSFISALAAAQNTSPKNLSVEAQAILEAYSWPGDIQQFKNVLEWMLITSLSTKSDCLGLEELPPEVLHGNPFLKSWSEQSINMASLPIKKAREIFEREYLQTQLKRFNGHISKTARFVGLDRASLHRKLKTLRIQSMDGYESEMDNSTNIPL
jgi:two-component system nitrogen regulation response regulator NtrX